MQTWLVCIYTVGMWLRVCVCVVYVVVFVALCVHVCSGRWLHSVWLRVHMWKSTLGVILQEPFILLSETISHWPGVCRVGVSQGGWSGKPRNPLPQHWDRKHIPHAQLFTRVLGTERKPSYLPGKHYQLNCRPSPETVGQLWNLALWSAYVWRFPLIQFTAN